MIVNGFELVKNFNNMAKFVRNNEFNLLNDAAKKFKEEAIVIITDIYNIKKSALSKRIEIKRATKAIPNASVKIFRTSRKKGKNTPPSFYSFKGTKVKKNKYTFKGAGKRKGFTVTKQEVTVQIIKGSKKTVKGAFEITTKRGQDVIVRRYAKNKLEGLSGPSPAAMAYGKAGGSGGLSRLPEDILDELVPSFLEYMAETYG